MTCCNCNLRCKKFGKFGPKKIQRYRCNACRKTFSEQQEKTLDNMRIPFERAEMCLKLLLEGNSIRSIQRITGLHQETILNLLVLAGERCEKLMKRKINGVMVKDVEADEIWGFVQCKNRHKLHKEITDPHVGDAYTFVGIERNTKLILAWHLGERGIQDTEAFTEKLHEATNGHFQLTTDGWRPYEAAVSYSLGTRVDYAMLIKVYGKNDVEGERKFFVAYTSSFKTIIALGLILGTAVIVFVSQDVIPKTIEEAFTKAQLSDTDYGYYKRRFASLRISLTFSAEFVVVAFIIFSYCRFPLSRPGEKLMMIAACAQYALGVYVGRKLVYTGMMLHSLLPIDVTRNLFRKRELDAINPYVHVASTLTVIFVYIHVIGYYEGPFSYSSILGQSIKPFLLLPAIIATPVLLIFNFYPRAVLRKVYGKSIDVEIKGLQETNKN